MSNFQVLEGSPGLDLDDVAHIMIPGRGRDETGHDLSDQGRARVEQAAALYNAQELARIHGLVVCSGYKTPVDTNGNPWSPDDAPHETFIGIPEADSMRRLLRTLGLGATAIRVERRSFDTVTNFANTEAGGYFGRTDERPVAIVAQQSHLERMLEIIAPRTLRRQFLGIVVPEDGTPDMDSRAARLVSRAILLGITPDTPHIDVKTGRRAANIWRVVNSLQRIAPSIST